ncbi:MAG: sugar phosphate isomerase/epimerase [Bacteroidetes bacterium]|nr:MAG: sugar phosphate isomerase/epimerase [Bacteroidota bacterium]
MTKRRDFIKTSALGISGIVTGSLGYSCSPSTSMKKPAMKFGLVTYMWGADWNLPTLISNCEKTGLSAVELRTHHAHGVETTLSTAQRAEVKKRFADSPVTCVGYGSNFEFHSPDPVKLRENIEQAKEYIKLYKEIGASGIKVKPNNIPPDVPKGKTITQSATSLNEIGSFAKDHGMLIRVEAHGPHTQELPNMKAIFDQVTESSVKICWNCNPVDLNPPGLEGNFNMVKKWIGDVVHIHQLNLNDYPYQQLFKLLSQIDFNGWLLLEDNRIPDNRIAAMKEQLAIFNEMTAKIMKE